MSDPKDTGTIIGADTVIKGEMTVENRAQILGRFEGSIKAKGMIEIANKAVCQADVEAGIVQIDGGMQGNIVASDKLALNATAEMRGDVLAAKLIVADGARVDGHFKVGPDIVKKGSAPAAPQQPSGPSGPGAPPQGGPQHRDVPGGPKK
ncbi:MAG: polymer-forming cytoskeletal protein [Planctomycetes bacterium]|nr:polymer-forming cytoskeletal protein [Planctomycetota bacterium]